MPIEPLRCLPMWQLSAPEEATGPCRFHSEFQGKFVCIWCRVWSSLYSNTWRYWEAGTQTVGIWGDLGGIVWTLSVGLMYGCVGGLIVKELKAVEVLLLLEALFSPKLSSPVTNHCVLSGLENCAKSNSLIQTLPASLIFFKCLLVSWEHLAFLLSNISKMWFRVFFPFNWCLCQISLFSMWPSYCTPHSIPALLRNTS